MVDMHRLHSHVAYAYIQTALPMEEAVTIWEGGALWQRHGRMAVSSGLGQRMTGGFLVSDGKVYSYYVTIATAYNTTLQIKVCTGWMLVQFWCPLNDIRI